MKSLEYYGDYADRKIYRIYKIRNRNHYGSTSLVQDEANWKKISLYGFNFMLDFMEPGSFVTGLSPFFPQKDNFFHIKSDNLGNVFTSIVEKILEDGTFMTKYSHFKLISVEEDRDNKIEAIL